MSTKSDIDQFQAVIMKWRRKIRQLEYDRLHGFIDKGKGADIRDAEINKGLASDLAKLFAAQDRNSRISEAQEIRDNIADLGPEVYFAIERIDGHIAALKHQADSEKDEI